MATAASSSHVASDSGLIDYPIVLGDSLKQGADSSRQLTSIRYNWQPQNGLAGNTSTLKQSDGRFALNIQDDATKTNSYVYHGKSKQPSSKESKHHEIDLVLVFDPVKSVYVLEAIKDSIDLNVKSAQGYSEPELRVHPLITSSGTSQRLSKEHANTATDDETADPDNPFDYRHFLLEARKSATKSLHNTGSLTPLPGSRTPMNGMDSPVPAASRFLSSTPQFRANVAPRKKHHTSSQVKKSYGAEQKARTAANPTAQSSKPLSQARISDSEDEMSDVAPLPQSVKLPKDDKTKAYNKKPSSGGFGKSPHVVVNDGDLEIDMGSPPPVDRSYRKVLVDPGVFRSHSRTPQRPQVSAESRAVEDADRQDTHMARSEDDDDVEALELGSPRTNRSEKQDEGNSELEEVQTRQTNDADDDEDLLAAELEAALEEEDSSTVKQTAGGIGLGIRTGSKQDDEESEVSEEE